MTVKICGLSTSEAVIAARDGGATHLGFIFFEKSPRHVSSEKAAALVKSAGSCTTVAVTVNADDAYLEEIVDAMSPDILQLHGSENVERVDALKAKFNLPVMKAVAIRDAESLVTARTYDGVADLLLLDAKPPDGSDLPGGNGVSFDWSLLAGLQMQTQVLLSGGIDGGNVETAIGHVRDAGNSIIGLDVSSGVESAPGVKDISEIKVFLAACR